MRGQAPRAEASTVVVVAGGSALDEVHDALEILVRTAGVRPILLTLGDQTEPRRSDRNGVTVIEGLVPRYLNNAVASLRLSSLPAIGWWRAPSTGGLTELADLVDRIVLDVEDPEPVWRLVPTLSERGGVSDLRWAGLTRWRDLFAQFFDLPDVRGGMASFSRLSISAGDRHAARLLAGWIQSRLPGSDRLQVAFSDDDTPAAVRSLTLAGGSIDLSLRLLPSDICIETLVSLPGTPPSSRVVTAGDRRIASLMAEELRVRSRDTAFEDAVAAAGGMA